MSKIRRALREALRRLLGVAGEVAVHRHTLCGHQLILRLWRAANRFLASTAAFATDRTHEAARVARI
jgi:hypothetical protein